MCMYILVCLCVALARDKKTYYLFHTHAIAKPHKQTQTGHYHSSTSTLQHLNRLVPRWPSITQHTAPACHLSSPSISSHFSHLLLRSALYLCLSRLPQLCSSALILFLQPFPVLCSPCLCLGLSPPLKHSPTGTIIPLRDYLTPKAIIVSSKNLKFSSLSLPSLFFPTVFLHFLDSAEYNLHRRRKVDSRKTLVEDSCKIMRARMPCVPAIHIAAKGITGLKKRELRENKRESFFLLCYGNTVYY